MYFDPGFGGMLLQVIVLIAAVGGGILFSFRKKIKNLFSKNKTDKEPLGFIPSSEDVIDVLDENI